VHYLDNKVLEIIDARCIHEIHTIPICISTQMFRLAPATLS